MHRSLWLVALVLLAALPASASVSGRAAPTCAEATLSEVSGAVAVDAGSCLSVDLGVQDPGSVIAVDLLVIDDAVDVLVFDAVAREPYDLGQGYRSGMTLPASTESMIGEQSFRWKVPPSIQPKSWSIVFDNLDHDGDNGLGDQGGSRAMVSLTMTPVVESSLTVTHDLFGLDANESAWLTPPNGLVLDAGTSLLLEGWALDGAGDLMILTSSDVEAWDAGGPFSAPSGRAILGMTGDATLSWVLPASYGATPLHLLLDASDRVTGGAEPGAMRATVRLTLDPPLLPVVSDDVNGTTVLGGAVQLDASQTPDRLGRLTAWAWDLDASKDDNEDGDPTNDVTWSTSTTTTAVWDTPGQITVTLHVQDVDGRTASTQHVIEVVDVTPPTAGVSSIGDEQPISDGYRIVPNGVLRLSCAPSTDDHRIESCAWSIDGSPVGQNTTVMASWSTPGEHTVLLTVSDPSGGTDALERRVVVTDPSPPRFTNTSLADLPVTVVAGTQVVVSVVVEDDVDEAEALMIHWDLDPLTDSDGNGVADDDADAMGSQVALTFEEGSTQTVVITVFDPSGNTARTVWTLDVQPEASSSGAPMGVFVVLGLLLLLAAGVVVRRRLATALPTAEPVPEPSPEEQAEAAKAAEMQAIYGSTSPVASSGTSTDVSGFAAPATYAVSTVVDAEAASLLGGGGMQASSASGTASLEALAEDVGSHWEATVSEEHWTPEGASAPESPATAPSTPASSPTTSEDGRLVLPAGMDALLNEEEAPPNQSGSIDAVEASCPACGQRFLARLPDGLSAAQAACPGCGGHVTVHRQNTP